jgi:hypothetical protein
VKSGEVLHRVTWESNILLKIEKRKVNWIGHPSRRNYLLKHVTEGKDGEEDVRRYWMTLRKREDTGN